MLRTLAGAPALLPGLACRGFAQTRRASPPSGPTTPPRPPQKAAIRITDIKTFLVGAGRRNWVFVKVETDQGLHGIGEAYSCGPDLATVEVIRDFKGWLTGHDPRDVEHLWAMMHNFTRFPGGFVVNAAISGIEHALWDIAGKAAGVPVYRLLGGKCRDRVRLYRSVGSARSALAAIEKHRYTAFKTKPDGMNRKPHSQVTRDFARFLGELREAVGPDVDLAVDIHAQFFEIARAVSMARAIEPFAPMWMEESIRPESAAAMAKLAQQVRIPLASGEANYTKYEFQEILAARALDVVQPDLCLCGGLWEGKKIAAMAEAHYVTVAPHNPNSPVGTAVAVHFAVATPNFVILEHTPDTDGVRRDVVKEPLPIKEGHIEPPTAPGLGVELNEEAFKHHPPRPWHRGFQFRSDGSVGWI